MMFFVVVSLIIVVLKSCEVMKKWYKNIKFSTVGIAPSTSAIAIAISANVVDEENTENSTSNHQNEESSTPPDVSYNNVQFNPEVITHPLLALVFIAFCAFISPLIYFYYFTKSTSTPSSFNWLTEFELFLNDLSLHVGMTILMPLILYARASNLRKFTLEALKQMFS